MGDAVGREAKGGRTTTAKRRPIWPVADDRLALDPLQSPSLTGGPVTASIRHRRSHLHALFLVLAACKGSVAASDTSPDGSTAVDATPATACADLYKALSTLAGCAPLPLDAPQDRFASLCEARLGAPGAGPAAAAAERCVAAIDAAVASCGAIDGDACLIPAGARAAGQPCGAALQCASGYCVGPESTAADGWSTTSFVFWGQALSVSPSLASCGTCVDRIPTGQACTLVGPECGPGCSTIGVPCVGDGQCTGPGPSATCGAPVPASSPGACTCADSGGGVVGQSCNPATTSGVCPTNLVCAYPSHTCQTVTLAAPGAACDGLAVQCATGACSFANKSTGALPGTCPATIDDGQPCTPGASDAVCGAGATCASPAGANGCCAGDAGGSGGPATQDAAAPRAVDAGGAPTCVFFDPRTCG